MKIQYKNPSNSFRKGQKMGTNVSTKEDIKMTVKHIKGLPWWLSW